MSTRKIPTEALVDLQRRLDLHPPRCGERRELIQQTAKLYGVSEDTVYRALRNRTPVKSAHRIDKGQPRILQRANLERYCEVIAALKIRTSNKKGHHLSTAEAIRLLEEQGIHTPTGYLKAPPGLLKRPTVNRYLKQWGYDHTRMTRQPTAVRFQAEHSNDCWHFDLSTSDLKHLKTPTRIEPGRGKPLLMLYSIVDDRSGLAYMEYHGVYGEDVEAALRFLFAAMSPKATDKSPFQGIPRMLYMDNGPIARSQVFQKVMGCLGVEVVTHLPEGKDGRRVTARSKGKVERPFRSVKEMHETLYHLKEPETELEANVGLMQFLHYYNSQPHRNEPHTRMEDWLNNLPPENIRQMCTWERFCTFAREPERRKVGIDARISIDGVSYEVDSDLAGETVTLWWGLFDNELYVEHIDKRYGPYSPLSGPIPLHRYRNLKKTRIQKRADRIETLAKQLSLSNNVNSIISFPNYTEILELPVQPFVDPDPFQELTFPNIIAAKRAIADFLGYPLAKLTSEQMADIDAILAQTLQIKEVMAKIRDYFQTSQERQNAQ